MLLSNIPVNLVTGFLGSGKTTFIKRLLEQKPKHEQWAVLVNEFGEIGLDGALLGESDGVVIREVPGGCLCCAAGVPTQVAIAQILRKAKPTRLLIEPTGLGHPDKILAALQAENFRGVLSVKSTLCLVDARNLQDSRYIDHELFNQQLLVADVVLASKADCYGDQEFLELKRYLEQIGCDASLISLTSKQALDNAILSAMSVLSVKSSQLIKSRQSVATGFTPLSSTSSGLNAANRSGASRLSFALKADSRVFDASEDEDESIDFNASGFCRKTHEGEGLYACGWCFSPEWTFDFDSLLALCDATPSLRLKAVMITSDGILAINRLEEALNLSELDDALDSRIEFISRDLLNWDVLESHIQAAGERQLIA